MTTIPIYNLLVLPGITLYLQKQYYQKLTHTEPKEHEEVTFFLLREQKALDEITLKDFYPIGVTGVINEIDDEGAVGIHTISRVTLESMEHDSDGLELSYSERVDINDMTDEDIESHLNSVKNALLEYVDQFQWGIIARGYITQCKSFESMIASMSSQLTISADEKYQILEADTTSRRVELMEHALYQLIETSKLSNEAEKALTKAHETIYREEALKKQIEFLQQKLDEMHPENVSDVRRFEKKIAESSMNETARKEADKVLRRMKLEGQNSHEYGMLYDYLDFVTSLSWHKEEFCDINLSRAEEILDSEHFGLKKAKQRIIQQIAVMALTRRQSGSILLFVGAPGTGKTSIGQSVAKALRREYVRVSLGGVRDEAEIRGHRRTYVGAMPGRIIEGVKRSGVSNPVMVLDEVDKLGKDFTGDPASALLEVLDPEQNSTFTDHYMNVPYDLSDVLFICTANSVDTIPEPLLNRMEVIQFQGYTESEKVQIARRHLLPRAMKATGLQASNLKVSDKTLHAIVADYTMEAGVRGLKKRLDTLCRTAAVKLVRGDQKSVTVSPKRLREFLDQKPIHHDGVREAKQSGIITGLAWTQAGGDILFIEAMFTKGSGKTIITGQLGDVMQESVQIAISLVKNRYPELSEKFEKNDLHIHVPAGAIPKDGPSAGITLTTAIASLVNEKSVSPTFAMTGEVSLRGNIMPIGGLPEKLMAALRAEVTTVFIPEENVEDLDEVASEVKDQLNIIPVHSIGDVLTRVGIE